MSTRKTVIDAVHSDDATSAIIANVYADRLATLLSEKEQEGGK